MRDPKYFRDTEAYTLKQDKQHVEIFRTNVLSLSEADRVLIFLRQAFTGLKFNFDLDDRDRILRVSGENISPDDITLLLSHLGLECELLH